MLLSILIALASGLLFGLGLILSGMIEPTKVIAFLDITGQWNPSLAFVMIGAIGTALLPFTWIKRRQFSLLGFTIHWPRLQNLDRRLIVGSLLFGVGWGWSGICPGPAVVLLNIAPMDAGIFVASMLAGIALMDYLFPLPKP